MEQYNNTIVSKIAEYVREIVKVISRKDFQERTIKLASYEVAEIDNIDLSTLQAKNGTATIDVNFYFEIYDNEGNLISKSESNLAIPRVINNMFIIEGKPRIPTQVLDNSFECRINDDFIKVNGDLTIKFDGTGDFVIETIDENYEQVFINKIQLENALVNNDLELLRYVKLSKDERLKFQIKLDVNSVPEVITPQLVQSLIELGSDKFSDSIIDKRISTVEVDLISNLYKWQNKVKICNGISKKFWTYGEIYLKDLQNQITRYFRVAADPTINIPDIINPLIYDSLRYKIQLPQYLPYNESFSDLIDPVNTPENNNVNKINELNVCSSVDDGIMYIYCYNIKGEKIKLKYIEYLNIPVIKNTDYDYDKCEIIQRSEYIIKLRLKEIKVTDLSIFDEYLVEPKADEKLSVTTRRIPLINMSDSVRVAMGAAMSKQAVEVESSEPALIVTGNDDIDFIEASQLIRYQGDGAIVESIKGNKIFVRDKETGSLDMFTISAPTVGQNESIVSYVPNVKEGQELKHNDIVISAKLLSRGTYELGVNARCIYMNYLGYSHEDGIIISQSFADKLTNYNITTVQIRLKPSSHVIKLLPLGTKVTSGDILVNAETPLNISRSLKDSYTNPVNILGNAGLSYSAYNLITPNNVDEGYVIGIKIESNPNEQLVSEGSEAIIQDFIKKNEISSDWDIIPERFKNLEIPDSEFNKEAYVITYKLIKVKRAILGSKLCNRYGSKGEVSLILPDNLMPRLDVDDEGNGPIADIILNPAAVISRKNPSQLYEVYMTKIISHIYNTAIKLCNDHKIQEAKEYTKNLYGNKFINLSDSEFISKLNKGISEFRVAVGSYATINFEKLKELANFYGVSETSYIYCPDVAIGETEQGKKAFDPSHLNTVNAKNVTIHELGFVESPVIDGYTYFMKLFHSADFTGKVTPDKIESEYPYMRKGLYRSEGQSIGEMELWATLAYGSESFVREGSDNKLTSQYEFINEMLLAGFTLVDDNDLPLLSEYRSKINKLKLSDLVKK